MVFILCFFITTTICLLQFVQIVKGKVIEYSVGIYYPAGFYDSNISRSTLDLQFQYLPAEFTIPIFPARP